MATDVTDQPAIDAAIAMRGVAIRWQYREGATIMQLASTFKLPPVEILMALRKQS